MGTDGKDFHVSSDPHFPVWPGRQLRPALLRCFFSSAPSSPQHSRITLYESEQLRWKKEQDSKVDVVASVVNDCRGFDRDLDTPKWLSGTHDKVVNSAGAPFSQCSLAACSMLESSVGQHSDVEALRQWLKLWTALAMLPSAAASCCCWRVELSTSTRQHNSLELCAVLGSRRSMTSNQR